MPNIARLPNRVAYACVVSLHKSIGQLRAEGTRSLTDDLYCASLFRPRIKADYGAANSCELTSITESLIYNVACRQS